MLCTQLTAYNDNRHLTPWPIRTYSCPCLCSLCLCTWTFMCKRWLPLYIRMCIRMRMLCAVLCCGLSFCREGSAPNVEVMQRTSGLFKSPAHVRLNPGNPRVNAKTRLPSSPPSGGVQKGTNGVSTDGVTASFMCFDRDFLGTPVNLLLYSQKCQGTPFYTICQNSLLLQRPH